MRKIEIRNEEYFDKKYDLNSLIYRNGLEYIVKDVVFSGFKNDKTHVRLHCEKTKRGEEMFYINKIRKEFNCNYMEAVIIIKRKRKNKA